MTKELIKILYVDDLIDRGISRSLFEYRNEKIEIEYEEIEYDKAYDYKKLIQQIEEKNINILVIDSALYVEADGGDKRLTGEKFKIILKKLLPYIETIVISQNEQDNNYDIAKKYNKDIHHTPIEEYYRNLLNPIINKRIEEVLMGREVLDDLKNEELINNNLIEKISLSLNGEEKYSELNSDDINKLIESFKELKESING